MPNWVFYFCCVNAVSFDVLETSRQPCHLSWILLNGYFAFSSKADDETLERLAGLDGINYDGEFRIREGKRASHVKTLAEVMWDN